MCKQFRVEVYKLVHSGAFWGLAVLTLSLASLLLLDSRRETATLFLASLYNTPLLYFLTIIFLAIFIGGDFSGRTLCGSLTSGCRRGALFFAKLLIAQLAALVILVLPLLVHGACGDKWGGTGVVIVAICCGILAMNMLLCFGVISFLMNGDRPESGYPLSRFLPMGQLRLLAMDALPISCGAMILIDVLEVCVMSALAWLIFRRRDFR